MGVSEEALVNRLFDNAANLASLVAPLTWDRWKKLDPWQIDLLLAEDKEIIVNASRQSGKSSTLMIKAIHKALSKPRSLSLIVAEQRQSNEDLKKARDIVEVLSKWLTDRFEGKISLGLITDAKTTLEFGNGSRVVALPANEKVRGYSAPNLIIIDEAGYLDDEVFIAVRPMLATGVGQLILASTPKGTERFFYHEWLNPRYRHFQVEWWKTSHITQEFIEKEKLLGEAYYRQEYCCEFLDDVSALFTERSLRASIDEDEEVLEAEMRNINKQLEGGVELV